MLYVTSSKCLLYIHFYVTLFTNCTLTVDTIYWFWSSVKGKAHGEVNEEKEMLFDPVLMIQCNEHIWCSIYVAGAMELVEETKMRKTESLPWKRTLCLYICSHQKACKNTISLWVCRVNIQGHKKKAFQIY